MRNKLNALLNLIYKSANSCETKSDSKLNAIFIKFNSKKAKI